MKLLNPNEPPPEDNPEEKSKTKPEEPPAGATRRIIRHAHPLTPPAEAESILGSGPEPPDPLQSVRRTQNPLRSSGQGIPARSRLSVTPTNPGARLRAAEEAGKNAKPAKLPLRYRLQPDRQKTRYAFWDVTSVFSLAANAVMLALLLIMAWQIRTLKQAVGKGLLGGLYSSFVDMDQASIETSINVQAQIPLSFNLPVTQNTDVSLTQNVSIPGAHVVINTALFNISAPANVTLPAGTVLPIALNMTIPVQATIPISLQVPVKIPLAGTGLHTPFVGLQTAIQPYYCMLEPNAQYPQGVFICRTTNASPTTTGAP
jgi:hypothetical protein